MRQEWWNARAFTNYLFIGFAVVERLHFGAQNGAFAFVGGRVPKQLISWGGVLRITARHPSRLRLKCRRPHPSPHLGTVTSLRVCVGSCCLGPGRAGRLRRSLSHTNLATTASSRNLNRQRYPYLPPRPCREA